LAARPPSPPLSLLGLNTNPVVVRLSTVSAPRAVEDVAGDLLRRRGAQAALPRGRHRLVAAGGISAKVVGQSLGPLRRAGFRPPPSFPHTPSEEPAPWGRSVRSIGAGAPSWRRGSLGCGGSTSGAARVALASRVLTLTRSNPSEYFTPCYFNRSDRSPHPFT